VNKEEFKEWVRNNLFTYNGRVNSVKSKTEYLRRFLPEILSLLLHYTSFLPEGVSNGERIVCLLNDFTERRKCKICGNYVRFRSPKSGYSTHCSSKCTNDDPDVKRKNLESVRETCQKKYGVNCVFQLPEVREKFEQTNLKNLGVKNPFQALMCKIKAAETCEEKYGESSYSKTKEFQERCREKSREIYGTDFPQQAQVVKDKIKKTCLALYGKTCFLYSDQHREMINQQFKVSIQEHVSDASMFILKDKEMLSKLYEYNTSTQMGQLLQVCQKTIMNYFKIHEIESKHSYDVSVAEKEVLEYVSSLGMTTESNTRKIISPLELDVYIPEFNFAIEYNGIFWHSSEDEADDIKCKYRHLMKTELCLEKGIQLFHIFENEWVNPEKQDTWKSLIAKKLGLIETVDSKDCELVSLPEEEAYHFFALNHLKGFKEAEEYLGLAYQGHIVAACSFLDKEITRYCSAKYMKVLGGLERLIEGRSELTIKLDRRYSLGTSLTAFKLQEILEPNYRWYKPSNTFELTREEGCSFEQGYRRLWDSGYLVYRQQ
jgi:hypothetical protein